MRRWNGWGDENTHYPLPAAAARHLEARIGKGTACPDASYSEILHSIPDSRLHAHPLISTDADVRLRHARGQSLPDWVALRSGRVGAFPDGVAYPSTDSEIQTLLGYSRQTGTRLIPYGGGTSVVGHINPLPGDPPSLTVDLSRRNRLIDLDAASRLATFEAGVSGPEIEAQLNRLGYTLGHFPQSFELSTLGGWIATRSSGQQSFFYGRIEDLFAGGHMETFLGPLDLPPFPASAAGPDLRQLVLGSEGRLGLVTRASVRVRPLPESENFFGIFFRDWEPAVTAVRLIVQSGAQVSMLRLSDPQETETTLALSGKEQIVAMADRGLSLLRYGPQRCLLICGVTGSRAAVSLARRQVLSLARAHGGLYTGSIIGKIWQKSRFRTPYLRNTLWEQGYALDTVETAVPWSGVLSTAGAVKAAIQSGLAVVNEPEPTARVLVFAHLSHIYQDGASIYITYIYHRAADAEDTLRRWQILKKAASQSILHSGGTISHQHGVGLDHAGYLPAEKGKVGMALLDSLRSTMDPDQLLNPGKLIDDVSIGSV